MEHSSGSTSPNGLVPPPGATPIDTDELLAAIGELYVQVRVLRRLLIRSQQAEPAPSPAKE